jgi:hypothetical protein
MKRFVFSLPEDLFLALQRRARERGTSAASVVRDAIEKEVCPPQPWPAGAGMFASGHRDTARRAGEEPARYDSSRYDQ